MCLLSLLADFLNMCMFCIPWKRYCYNLYSNRLTGRMPVKQQRRKHEWIITENLTSQEKSSRLSGNSMIKTASKTVHKRNLIFSHKGHIFEQMSFFPIIWRKHHNGISSRLWNCKSGAEIVVCGSHQLLYTLQPENNYFHVIESEWYISLFYKTVRTPSNMCIYVVPQN